METIFTLILIVVAQFFGLDTVEVDNKQAQVVSAEEYAYVTSIVDGDTIRVQLNNIKETVRYIGIDTPEPYRDGEPACYSIEASDRNRKLVADREVRLVPGVENRDRFGRLLRYVYVDDLFVNEQLVIEGYATIMTIAPNTQFESVFLAAESTAQQAKLGLWSACVE